jgi:hypothetical protein
MVEGLEEHVVERIRDHRDVKRRKGSRTVTVREYLVRWKGYGESDDQWLTDKELNRGCPLKPLLEYQADLLPAEVSSEPNGSTSRQVESERPKRRQGFSRSLPRERAKLRMLNTEYLMNTSDNISEEGKVGLSGCGRSTEIRDPYDQGTDGDRIRTGQMRGIRPLEYRTMIEEYEDELKITSTIKGGKLVKLTSSDRPLKVLVLFSGTGSVEAAISRRFPKAQVITLDLDPKWQAIHCCDIVDWVSGRGRIGGTMNDYGRGYFDFVWASPPCTEYSFAKTVGERNFKLADARVRATLYAIEYLNPKYFVIENPKGLLYKREIMNGYIGKAHLPDLLHNVCYCKYGTRYKKPTQLWTNIIVGNPLSKCTVLTPCESRRRFGIHLQTAQSGATRAGTPGAGKSEAVYPIPEKLLDNLLTNVALEEQEDVAFIYCMLELVEWI